MAYSIGAVQEGGYDIGAVQSAPAAVVGSVDLSFLRTRLAIQAHVTRAGREKSLVYYGARRPVVMGVVPPPPPGSVELGFLQVRARIQAIVIR